jgi:hypothetical protein
MLSALTSPSGSTRESNAVDDSALPRCNSCVVSVIAVYAPVAIETWAIVNDAPEFVRTTLEQLGAAALAGENWLAAAGVSGNWLTA